MAERELSVKLSLTAPFGNAATEASNALKGIGDNFDTLAKKGSSVFDGLEKSLGAISEKIATTGKDLDALSAKLGEAGIKASEINKVKSGLDNLARSSKEAKDQVDGVAKSVGNIGKSSGVQDAKDQVDLFTGATKNAQDALNGLLRQVNQRTDRGFFSPLIDAARQLEANVNSARESMAALRSEMTANAIGRGYQLVGETKTVESPPSASAIRDRYRQLDAEDRYWQNRIPIEGQYVQRAERETRLTGGTPFQAALGPARDLEAEVEKIDTYFARMANAARTAAEAAAQASQRPYDPHSAITPYVYQGEAMGEEPIYNARFRDIPGPREYTRNGQSYIPGEFEQTGGYVAPEGGGFSGPSLGELDEGIAAERRRSFNEARSHAEHMYSSGEASLYNAGMIGDMLIGPFKNAMGVQTLDTQNALTARSNDATGDTAARLTRMAHQAYLKEGGEQRDVVSSLNAFMGSMSPSVNINDPQWQKSMAFAVDRANMVSRLSSLSGAPLSANAAAIGMNQGIANLGFDTSTPQAFGNAAKEVTNALVMLKNVTPSTVEQSLGFMKAVGPLAALDHVKPEDMFGMMWAFGKEKMVGSTAGNSLKRLMQRETLPTEKTEKVQAAVKQYGFDLSMYDEKGHGRSIVDVLQQFVDWSKKTHPSDQTKSAVLGQLTGLYANTPIAAMEQLMEKYGGEKGIRAEGQRIGAGVIAGSKKDAVNTEMDAQANNVEQQFSTAGASVKEAWQSTFDAISPQLIKLAHLIKDLADGWKELPAGFKAGVIDAIAVGGALALVNGIINVFVGNTLKSILFAGQFFGLFKTAPTSLANTKIMFEEIGGSVVGFGKNIFNVGRIVVTAIADFLQLRAIPAILEGLGTAWEVLSGVVATAIGAISVPVVLIGAAIAALAVAWVTDFGHIREGAAALWKGIGDFAKGTLDTISFWSDGLLPNFKAVADGFHWLVGIAVGAAKAIEDAFQKVTHTGKYAVQAHMDAASSSHRGDGKNAPKAPKSIWDKILEDFEHFGNSGVPSTPPPVALPETPGMADTIQEALHPAKGKKKKANPNDVDVHFGDIPVDELEKYAQMIEDKWANVGAKHKISWVDLIDKSGNTTRVYGEADAFREAAKQLAPDKGLREKVELYIANARLMHEGVQKEVNGLNAFLKQAHGLGLRAYIEDQIAGVDHKRLEDIAKASTKTVEIRKQLYGEGGSMAHPAGGLLGGAHDSKFDDTLDSSNRTFEELQEGMKGSIPTISQLKELYNSLATASKSLGDESDTTKEKLDKLNGMLVEETNVLQSIKGSDQAANDQRIQAQHTIDALKKAIADTNYEYTTQQAVLGRVNAQMDLAADKYNKAYLSQKLLTTAIQQANQAMKQQAQTEGTNLVSQGLVGFNNHLIQPTTRHTGGAFADVAHSAINSYLSTLGGGIFSTLFGGNKTQTVKDVEGNQALSTINKTLTDNGATEKTNSDHLKTVADSVTGLKGATVTGGALVTTTAGQAQYATGGTQAKASPTSPASDGSITVAKKDLGHQIQDALNSKTAKTIEKTVGAIAGVIAGTQEGGFAGAETAGFAAASATDNPYAIGAAAILGFIGIGSKATPATSPDIYNTQVYGQEEANLYGAGFNNKPQEQANGNYFVMDQDTQNVTGGLGEIQYIQQWAQAHINDANPSVAQMAKDDLAKYGAYNPNAKDPNQIIHYDTNIGNEQVIGGTESGNYQQIYNDATQAANSIQQLSSAALQAAQNAKALADSFTTMTMGGVSGFKMPYLGSVAAGNASSSFLPKNVMVGSGNQGNTRGVESVQQQVVISLFQGATVGTSDTNYAALQDAIQQALPAIVQGVNQSNYNSMRYLNGYQSQVS